MNIIVLYILIILIKTMILFVRKMVERLIAIIKIYKYNYQNLSDVE